MSHYTQLANLPIYTDLLDELNKLVASMNLTTTKGPEVYRLLQRLQCYLYTIHLGMPKDNA